uniref:Uncharacterized protein n=1 Tax=Cacopsylla melanoneura TaxID=428564 RepID=A0A8D8W0M4_9HEMI
MELGDRTPSQLLREIQNLAGTDLPDHIIHGLWLKKLNGVTQQILAVASNTPLTQQAERADKVTSVHVPNRISAVTPSPEIDTSDQIAALAAQVKTLTTAVDELMRSRGSQHSRHMSLGYQQQSRHQSPGFPPHRTKSVSRDQDDTSFRWCRIHNKYKKNARFCSNPKTCMYLNDMNERNNSPSST